MDPGVESLGVAGRTVGEGATLAHVRIVYEIKLDSGDAYEVAGREAIDDALAVRAAATFMADLVNEVDSGVSLRRIVDGGAQPEGVVISTRHIARICWRLEAHFTPAYECWAFEDDI